jgi:hypothetical protein
MGWINLREEIEGLFATEPVFDQTLRMLALKAEYQKRWVKNNPEAVRMIKARYEAKPEVRARRAELRKLRGPRKGQAPGKSDKKYRAKPEVKARRAAQVRAQRAAQAAAETQEARLLRLANQAAQKRALRARVASVQTESRPLTETK